MRSLERTIKQKTTAKESSYGEKSEYDNVVKALKSVPGQSMQSHFNILHRIGESPKVRIKLIEKLNQISDIFRKYAECSTGQTDRRNYISYGESSIHRGLPTTGRWKNGVPGGYSDVAEYRNTGIKLHR